MISETLQFGQSSVPPHWRQNTAVASPRRFSRIERLLARRQPRVDGRSSAAR